MIRKYSWLLLSLTLVPFGAFAQPPEEVPPPLPDNVLEIEAIPADSDLMAPQPEILAQPVAEPLEAPVVKEDTRLKGVSLSPSIGVFPIGYDSINLAGEGEESGRVFFMVQPNLSLSTSFKTATDRTVNLDIGYTGIWREYYNKASTRRDFETDIFGSIGIDWTDRISTSVGGLFIHFFKAGTDNDIDNALVVEATPSLDIKATDELSFKLGYWSSFVSLPDLELDWYEINGTTNPPTDLDEFSRGVPYSNATYANNFASGGSKEPVWWNHHAARLGLTYKPFKGTSIGMDYRYIFSTMSNNDNSVWTGHLITPSIKQALPWKGGTFVMKDQIRIRKYKHAMIHDGAAVKQDYRNRITIGINQAINEYMTAEFFYRLQLRGVNSENYDDLHPDSWGYMGVSFAF